MAGPAAAAAVQQLVYIRRPIADWMWAWEMSGEWLDVEQCNLSGKLGLNLQTSRSVTIPVAVDICKEGYFLCKG